METYITDVDRSISLDLLEDTRGASCPLKMEGEHHSEHEVPLNVKGRAEESALPSLKRPHSVADGPSQPVSKVGPLAGGLGVGRFFSNEARNVSEARDEGPTATEDAEHRRTEVEWFSWRSEPEAGHHGRHDGILEDAWEPKSMGVHILMGINKMKKIVSNGCKEPIEAHQKKVEEKQVNQVALTDLETEREEIVQSERDSHEGGKLVNICVSHFLFILWNDLIEEYLFMEAGSMSIFLFVPFRVDVDLSFCPLDLC